MFCIKYFNLILFWRNISLLYHLNLSKFEVKISFVWICMKKTPFLVYFIDNNSKLKFMKRIEKAKTYLYFIILQTNEQQIFYRK